MTGIEAVNTSYVDRFNIVIQEAILENFEWYKHIIFYLKIGQFPLEMSLTERRTLKIKANKYVLVSGVLFRRNFDGILLRCLDHIRAMKVIQESHKGIFGGHFSPVMTAHKIIHIGFYWPMIFKDSYEFIQKCIPCQNFSGKMKRVVIPLQTSMVEQPFIQWGLDVIGLINPKYRKVHSYIVTTIDYFTKWQEAMQR
jgi:hypothetical protein